MSVFLRWGIFGILGFAALLYAYNASKRMAERHAEQVATQPAPAPAPVAVAPAVAPALAVSQPAAVPVQKAPAYCEAELVVAQRALDARKQGEPLDRLLRIQEIAWQEPPARRQRLEKVATEWFNREGDWLPEALRIAVVSNCIEFSPNPDPAP
jgi:hypothetical protein